MQLIDETLADHEKLVEKTQVWRGKGARIGAVPEDSEDQDRGDVEIFDDTDFYQRLLRDIIDSRGGGEGGDDWLVQQKQKKAKKKVDTKASKGRKLRFAVSYLILSHYVYEVVIGTKSMRNFKTLWFPCVLG